VAAALMLALALCLGADATHRGWAAAAENPPPIRAAAGAAAPRAAQPSALATSQMPAVRPEADERAAVVNFLGYTIAWYRALDTEEGLATEPAEMLFVDDDRRMAIEAVKLAFEYARAEAALLKAEKAVADATAGPAAPGAAGAGKGGTSTALPGLDGLTARIQDERKALDKLKQETVQLNAQMASAKREQRATLARQLAIVQSQTELAQARLDSYNAIVQFETTNVLVPGQGAGLSAQIDALERGIPQLSAPSKAAAAVPAAIQPAAAVATQGAGVTPPAPDSGLLGAVEALLQLGKAQDSLDARISETRRLASQAEAARTPLVARLHELNARADALAATPDSDDLAASRVRKQQFDDLIKRHKMIADALLPLTKQDVVLQLYSANLEQWIGTVKRRSDDQLRRLIFRLSALGVVLLAIFIGAFVWRRLTLRYVQDLRRRRQLLQLRRLTVALVVALVLLFDFASQLGTLATVMGFAAAGIALALQNVILSFAGYFFVTGRYGIRVGDRIQIAGISGDVIDIGLFKLALMELVGDGNSRQPTGRVVIFPNSIVFQSNGNFFKQAPGTNFVWNEFRLTLAPECDYRVAEKRLLEVVEDVYARYRDAVQRQYSNLEREVSMKFESPRPQSRLRLGANGIELTIRYPADTRHSVQVADEISRRALDAIAQDPALALAMPGTPNLMPMASSAGAPLGEVAAAPVDGHDAALAPEVRGGSAMMPAGAEVVVENPAGTPAPSPPAQEALKEGKG
ncbi:MAG TPA: mechanosensitive ion channel domain-containing protein, partial [Candidatus Binataceae bacterium]